MNKIDLFILVSTFFVGVAAGAYVYFNGFRTIDLEPPKERVADWVVEVSTYGGCLRGGGCGSYRLSANGDYTLVPEGGQPAVSGTLAKDWLTILDAELRDAPYAIFTAPRSVDDCDSYFDGIDTTYRITIAETAYDLDTCTTMVDVDASLIERLDELFEVLAEG